MKQLYTYKCLECGMIFRTDNPEQKVCSDCLKYRQPCKRYKKKEKAMSLLECAAFIEKYNREHKTHYTYGTFPKHLYKEWKHE